jgi:hypothetical protein
MRPKFSALLNIRGNRYTVDVPTVTGPASCLQPAHLDEVKFIRYNNFRHPLFYPRMLAIADILRSLSHEDSHLTTG